MRGFHRCEFCKFDKPQIGPIYAELHGETAYLGFAEIRATHPDGTIFVAPTMIFHYVRDHKYKPPEKFIEAVRHTFRQTKRTTTWLGQADARLTC